MNNTQLHGKAIELLEFFENKDDGYYPDNRTAKHFEVNVKLHKIDTCYMKILEKIPKNFHKRIIEHFTDEAVYEIYDLWLDGERHFLYEMFKMKGAMQASNEKWWNEDIGTKIESGKETWYPAIDKLTSKKAKMTKLNEFIKEDKEILDSFSFLKEDSFGFYGRMGGHFCFDINFNLDELEVLKDCWIEDGKDWNLDDNGYQHYPEDKKGKKEEIERIIKEAEEARDAVLFMKQFIEDQKNGLDFQIGLREEIEEYVAELKEEEAEARKIKKEAKEATTETMQSTLADLLLSNNEQIKRLAKGIYKELER